MARRQLLTQEERRLLFGVPTDRDVLVRHHTLTRADLDLVATRRGDPNRLGFAVQLALLRHPGLPLVHVGEPIDALVDWIARQLDIPASLFAEYASRPQIMTDHAREAAAALGLRAPTKADLPFLIEAAAQAAYFGDFARAFRLKAPTVSALPPTRSASWWAPLPNSGFTL